MESSTKRLTIFLILPLALLATVVGIANYQSRPDPRLRLNFYAVGGGGATLIQTPLGSQIIIDGGSTDQILTKLGTDLPFFDRTIDLVILTIPATDHVTGLVDILKHYQVKKVLLPDVKFTSAAYKEFLDLVAAKRVEKIYAQEGQRIWLDNSTVFDIYSPSPGEIDAAQASDLDQADIIGKLSFGQTHVLFLGTSDSNQLYGLIHGFDLQSQILKFTAKTVVTDDFNQAVKPEFTIQPADEAKFVSDGKTLDKK